MRSEHTVLVAAGTLFLVAWGVVLVGSSAQRTGGLALLFVVPASLLWLRASDEGREFFAQRRAARAERMAERAEILAELEARDAARSGAE